MGRLHYSGGYKGDERPHKGAGYKGSIDAYGGKGDYGAKGEHPVKGRQGSKGESKGFHTGYSHGHRGSMQGGWQPEWEEARPAFHHKGWGKKGNPQSKGGKTGFGAPTTAGHHPPRSGAAAAAAAAGQQQQQQPHHHHGVHPHHHHPHHPHPHHHGALPSPPPLTAVGEGLPSPPPLTMSPVRHVYQTGYDDHEVYMSARGSEVFDAEAEAVEGKSEHGSTGSEGNATHRHAAGRPAVAGAAVGSPIDSDEDERLTGLAEAPSFAYETALSTVSEGNDGCPAAALSTSESSGASPGEKKVAPSDGSVADDEEEVPTRRGMARGRATARSATPPPSPEGTGLRLGTPSSHRSRSVERSVEDAPLVTPYSTPVPMSKHNGFANLPAPQHHQEGMHSVHHHPGVEGHDDQSAYVSLSRGCLSGYSSYGMDLDGQAELAYDTLDGGRIALTEGQLDEMLSRGPQQRHYIKGELRVKRLSGKGSDFGLTPSTSPSSTPGYREGKYLRPVYPPPSSSVGVRPSRNPVGRHHSAAASQAIPRLNPNAVEWTPGRSDSFNESALERHPHFDGFNMPPDAYPNDDMMGPDPMGMGMPDHPHDPNMQGEWGEPGYCETYDAGMVY